MHPAIQRIPRVGRSVPRRTSKSESALGRCANDVPATMRPSSPSGLPGLAHHAAERRNVELGRQVETRSQRVGRAHAPARRKLHEARGAVRGAGKRRALPARAHDLSDRATARLALIAHAGRRDSTIAFERRRATGSGPRFRPGRCASHILRHKKRGLKHGVLALVLPRNWFQVLPSGTFRPASTHPYSKCRYGSVDGQKRFLIQIRYQGLAAPTAR
jgi:hypothetical protein